MSLSIYEKHLKDIPKKYSLLQFFRPPIYVIELSNNQLIAVCYYKDGSHKRYQLNAEFSNRRMVIADFNKGSQAAADLFVKFPQRIFGVRALAMINVTEILTDGLTGIEVKVIYEMFSLAAKIAKRNDVISTVRYQGQEVAIERFG